MKLTNTVWATAIASALMATSLAAHAESKKELVQKLLTLQQPGIENAARSLVERPAAQMMQEAGRVLQTQIPADKREAIGKSIEADAKRYVEETLPPVRERALKLAPTTLSSFGGLRMCARETFTSERWTCLTIGCSASS